jgi:hypothetical protein
MIVATGMRFIQIGTLAFHSPFCALMRGRSIEESAMRRASFHRFTSPNVRGAVTAWALGMSLIAASGLPAAAQPPETASPARMETVAVALDHARVVKLPERTATVIVGNPVIADVAVQKNGILVVTGKSYGQTNLIALDSNGAMLAESQISVRQSHESVMTVQRGLERESYSCTPHCQPSIQLGDAVKYFGDAAGQAAARNSAASSAK